jgi:hypothetical protein
MMFLYAVASAAVYRQDAARAMQLLELESLAAAHGLALRGGFHPAPADEVPPLPGGAAAASLVLLGNIGGGLWPAFSGSPEAADGAPHPLDRWTKRVVDGIARGSGAAPLYPFGGPPYRPFQRWARRAEPVHPSPLGILIHPRHGLWHAYRAALVFARRIELPPRTDAPSPCASCAAKPCLSACPVGAFDGAAFDVAACAGHISAPAGAPCMAGGCLARNACPVAPELRYPPAQTRFHMAAFRAARGNGA